VSHPSLMHRRYQPASAPRGLEGRETVPEQAPVASVHVRSRGLATSGDRPRSAVGKINV
jgi:hypothetical protein